MSRIHCCLLALAFSLGAGCLSETDPVTPPRQDLSLDTFREDLKTLSSDEFEGRGPGTPGGEKAAQYIADRFRAMGLKAANGESYFQNVPLMGITPNEDMQLVFDRRGGRDKLVYRDDFVAWAGVEEEELSLDKAPLVFVGYGVSAPEASWDDYKDGDFAGKVLLAFVNDPPSDDPNHFGGKALTYYGRWTYKLEEAARRGAAGVILIHNTDMAGYPWTVVSGSWTGEQFSLPAQGGKSTQIEGWIQQPVAEALFKRVGLSWEQALEKASKPDFQPVEVPVKVSLSVRSKIRRIESPNVVALLEGSDEDLKNQVVVVTAHYDHLGVGQAPAGSSAEIDLINNGAFDNASGTAGIMEVARAMAGSAPPRRSVLFAAVTAEEQGLLGSKYYAESPLFPFSKTTANVNVDGLNLWGRAKDIVPMGAERSDIEQVVQAVAAEMGMTLSPDPSPEKGHYFRSDHFSLVKKGIPAVYLDMGLQFEGKPDDWGRKLIDDYTAHNYHQPSDEYDPSWPLDGSLQAMQFIRKTIEGLANRDQLSQWKPGDPFEAIRQESLEGGR